MIEIRKIKQFTMEDEKSLGLNGFYSYGKFKGSKIEHEDELIISLKLEKLEKPIKKEWPHLKEDIERYHNIIKDDLSFGAYENNRLIGIIILENRKWHNTLWIENLQVSESKRNRGIGSLLLETAISEAVKLKLRVIGLETQNINLPAISLYKKYGFEIDGLDLSLYSNNKKLNGEFALYMKKKL